MPTADFTDLRPYAPGLRAPEILARFRRVADEGLLRHALPERYGGYGDDFQSLVNAHKRLGEASRDPGLILTVNAHLWGTVFPILKFGSEAQKETFIPKLIRGEWLAGHAITEPGCGSDTQAMSSSAVWEADGFRLRGEKRYISNAPIADWLVVYAKVDEDIAAFLVSAHDPGCRFFEDREILACRGSVIGSVVLDNCRLGKNRLLGKAGSGARILQYALELERAYIFAGISGVMAWQLNKAVEHSRVRRSGNTHLGHHQAISHRVAEMKLRLDTLELWLRRCAKLCDQGQRLTMAAAQTKLYAAEAFLQSSIDAIQILGASALDAENGLANLVEDALAGRLFSGSSEVQRNIIAGLLGTGDAYRTAP